jgi:glycosyltransferase involved in cell wall biosynthesis
MGYVSEEVKMQLLDVADIYVLSSLHEGFGIVLQEAMQVGLPIVSTNNGGQTDFLIEKKNALLISPKRPHEIAQKVKELFLDTLLMKNIKIRNKKDISKYSAKNICHQYLQLIKT